MYEITQFFQYVDNWHSMWSWKTWKCTELLCILIFQCMAVVLKDLEFHRSIAVLLLHCCGWSCNGCHWQLWILMGLAMVVFTLKGGNDEKKWSVMHWLTCGLGRGSPASDSLTLSWWSSAVTSADVGPNPLHDRIDSGCCLRGPLWCTRWWTPIPGSEGWCGQVFNCTGMSRTRDGCSKCAGMSMKLNVWWDEWWDS